MSVRRSHLAALLTVAVAGVALTACTEQKKDVSADGAVQVNATDSACELSKTTFPAGPVNFSVTN
ncbi:iron uptake system protein EfeO, partial [Kitasatospora sp. NPDC001664]